MSPTADHGIYAPTEHHLRRLREQGRGPHSGAARGTAVLAGAGLAAWAGVGLLPRFLGASLSMASIESPAVGAQMLPQLVHSWSLLALMAVGLLSALAFGAWAADAILAGVSRQRRALVSRAAFHPGALWSWLIALVCQVAALVLGCVWLWRAIMAYQADPLRFAGAFSSSAAMVIGVIALSIAVLDAAVARVTFLSSARMSRQQFLEEQKETGSPPGVVLRRTARLRHRR